jgi:hypothetical protein
MPESLRGNEDVTSACNALVLIPTPTDSVNDPLVRADIAFSAIRPNCVWLTCSEPACLELDSSQQVLVHLGHAILALRVQRCVSHYHPSYTAHNAVRPTNLKLNKVQPVSA